MEKNYIRIGIIGSDSSHAEVFSKLINIPQAESGELLFPDCKVTAIYGHDVHRTKEVAHRGRIDFIANTIDEMMVKVDAAMIVFRDGDLHSKYAYPFIKAGIPVWIDKPFALKDEDAEDIISAAKRFNTLLTGGSTCKYAEEILLAKSAVNNNTIGKIKEASISFSASFNDQYGGIYFYGSHLLEMALQVFGYNPKAVSSVRNGKAMTSVLKYESYEVVLNFIENLEKGSLVIHGEKETLKYDIDISDVYMKGLNKFIQMLRTRQLPFPIENLYYSVKIFNVILRALDTKEIIVI